jgi:hypothetical protein
MTFSLLDELNFLSTFKLSEQFSKNPPNSSKKTLTIQSLSKFQIQLQENGQWGEITCYLFITLKGEKKHILADS